MAQSSNSAKSPKEPAKTGSQPNAEGRKRRRIRPAQTMRQQAEKAQASAAKPKHARLSGPRRVLGTVFGPFGRILKKIFNRKPFRFIGKILFPVYFRNSFRELRLVTWPTWKQSRQLTFAVIVFAVVFGAIVAGMDYGFDKAFRHILIGK